MAASARHETRALLRAHLAAASSYGHLTSRCPACHRLLRLAMESAPGPPAAAAKAPRFPDARQKPLSGALTPREAVGVLEPPEAPGAPEAVEPGHPSTA
ncbi:DUF6274 family protein [Streptomyces sp. NPDC057197]|uniref:DUF6274 family protein n=1 Tax=Streptomyces sp. NPDC057197 TaxID=3346045 RepID=UPI0036399BB8